MNPFRFNLANQEKVRDIQLNDFVNYIIKYIEWYKFTNSPMHQCCHNIMEESEEIIKCMNITFDRVLNKKNINKLILRRD